MAAVSFSVGADTLGGSALLIFAPAALITAILWSALRQATVLGGAVEGTIDLRSPTTQIDVLI
jgi:hypothetical protein